MCKNKTWKIRTRTSEEGVVLEIRTHPDWGWFENPRFWRTSFVGLNLWFVYVNSRARKYHYTICNRALQKSNCTGNQKLGQETWESDNKALTIKDVVLLMLELR